MAPTHRTEPVTMTIAIRWALVVVAALGTSIPAHGQTLADVCRPVERPVPGGWARYRLRGATDSTELRMAMVGTASWNGAAHVWLESIIPTPAGEMVIQSLVPAEPYDPTAIRRAVVWAAGRNPVEVPASQLNAMRERAGQGAAGLDACRNGDALGWETVEVPAGPVRAMHIRYERNGRTADVWLAPGIPFAVVRSLVAGTEPVELLLIAHGRDAVPSIPLPAPKAP